MANQMLGDRYQVQQQLARKAGRQTLLARDLETGELVVVKLLSFSSDFEWDDLKLFEREAETLKALSHPCIPNYINYFELNSQSFQGFALIQSYIDARSLESHLKAGRNFSEAEVKQIAIAILEILIYLHERQPAVIHRDIKPSNILLGDRTGNSVGQVYLVDFGSVQNLAAREGATMTIVGTYGYMPPEQFGGRSFPSSDLYSLGATLIYQVTGTAPAELPQKDGRIQFEDEANINPDFANWLKRMTQPSLDRRFDSAHAALQSLNQNQQSTALLNDNRPTSSKFLLEKDIISFNIFLFQVSDRLFDSAMLSSILYLIFHIAVFFILTLFVLGSAVVIFPLGFFVPNIIPWWLLYMNWLCRKWTRAAFRAVKWMRVVFRAVGRVRVGKVRVGKVRLRLTQREIFSTYKIFGFEYNRSWPPKTQDIDQLEYIQKAFTKNFLGKQVEVRPRLRIRAGTHKYELVSNDHLVESELERLACELSNCLALPITLE